jgi:hypothetical protein
MAIVPLAGGFREGTTPQSKKVSPGGVPFFDGGKTADSGCVSADCRRFLIRYRYELGRGPLLGIQQAPASVSRAERICLTRAHGFAGKRAFWSMHRTVNNWLSRVCATNKPASFITIIDVPM